MAACPGCRDRPARPENDHDAYHTPQSRRNAERAAVFPVEPRRQCRRPDRACRRQRSRKIHPAALRGRRDGSERRRNHEIPRADDWLCRAARAGSSDGPAASTRPCSRRSPPTSGTANSWRVDVALESLEVPEALRQQPLKTPERRLAAVCHARPRAGDRARRAVARRADQPPRSRPDRPAGKLAERAAARHARRHIQPRPRLSRRDHEPDAVPAAGAVADVFIALYAGARRTSRGRRIGRAALSTRPQDRPATPPAARRNSTTSASIPAATSCCRRPSN